MALEIMRNGIAHRQEDGTVILHRPGKNGSVGTQVAVETALAEEYNLAAGDVVAGRTEPIPCGLAEPDPADPGGEDALLWEEQWDEPGAVRGVKVPVWLATHIVPSERLITVERLNGLNPTAAKERPRPRRRSAYERATPDRLLPLATGPADLTGRMIDFAAPLGSGYAGIIYGPHAAGLTRTLRAVVAGVSANASDCLLIVLLLRARGEELTDWRRRFPNAEIVVCPTPQNGATPEQMLQMADLTLACAQRQTELGRAVVLAVDSLTGLWGAMLETEEADAQARADHSRARQRIREWMQAAGNFSGEGLLGSSLGGALTLVGTVWQRAIDPEAEEEREVHPHLRLLEQILHETSWRVPLSEALAAQRLYPAIDTARCLSEREENLLPPTTYEALLSARRALAGLSPLERYHALMDALEATPDNTALITRLSADRTP